MDGERGLQLDGRAEALGAGERGRGADPARPLPRASVAAPGAGAVRLAAPQETGKPHSRRSGGGRDWRHGYHDDRLPERTLALILDTAILPAHHGQPRLRQPRGRCLRHVPLPASDDIGGAARFDRHRSRAVASRHDHALVLHTHRRRLRHRGSRHDRPQRVVPSRARARPGRGAFGSRSRRSCGCGIAALSYSRKRRSSSATCLTDAHICNEGGAPPTSTRPQASRVAGVTASSRRRAARRSAARSARPARERSRA